MADRSVRRWCTKDVQKRWVCLVPKDIVRELLWSRMLNRCIHRMNGWWNYITVMVMRKVLFWNDWRNVHHIPSSSLCLGSTRARTHEHDASPQHVNIGQPSPRATAAVSGQRWQQRWEATQCARCTIVKQCLWCSNQSCNFKKLKLAFESYSNIKRNIGNLRYCSIACIRKMNWSIIERFQTHRL